MKLENLTKYYDNFKAVDNIDFKIMENEITGFIGKNGAGKSTTINMILKLIYPSSGSVLANKVISFVPSEPAFYENLTVKEILTFQSKVTDCKKEKIDELCTYFELDLHKKVQKLSLGNKKKLAIVSALIKDYEILVLDEPTSGLDPLMQSKLFEYLLKEKTLGKTIFLSSHNLSEVEMYCDRVIVIKNGEIINSIDMKSLKDNKKFKVKYKLTDGSVKDFFSDNLNELVKELSLLDLVSLEINKENIKDEFLYYYKDEM